MTRCRPLREDRAEQTDPAKLLEGTPLATADGHAPARTPLSVAEQANVVAVMVVSQAIQVVLFTAGPVRLLSGARHRRGARRRGRAVVRRGDLQVGAPPCPGTWFGIHVPVPQTIVHVSLLVAVLSGLYFTVSTSVDPLYRERFFEPLISDVAVSLAGRDAYLETLGQAEASSCWPGRPVSRWRSWLVVSTRSVEVGVRGS